MRKTWRKRWLSLILSTSLAASSFGFLTPAIASADTLPAAGTPYDEQGTYDVTVPHVVIHQVLGDGGKTSDSVSHNFIELYNPTDSDVSLDGWTLNYSAGGTSWTSRTLTGTIHKHSSYLVLGQATGVASAKLNLTASDETWADLVINNKAWKLALLSTSADLSATANPFTGGAGGTPVAGYVDMVGTSEVGKTAIDGSEGTASSDTSKNKSLRRKNALADTDNNADDFTLVDYNNASTDIASVRPRSGADGEWGYSEAPALEVTTDELPDGQSGAEYSASIAVSGGVGPFAYEAKGLPSGLSINGATGAIFGTPAADAYGEANVIVTVTDSEPVPVRVDHPVSLYVNSGHPLAAAPANATGFSIEKIAGYSIGYQDPEGGVAEIVKYNKDNKKFYLVNGHLATLEIVSLVAGQSTLTKDRTIDVEALSKLHDSGFAYGDLTSVAVDTANDRIVLAVQEADPMRSGKILVLGYDGSYIKEYEAGVQPDMIAVTTDGRYILTADEGEPRTAAGDPDGSVTIVDTTADEVTHVKFDNPAAVADSVIIRGPSSAADKMIAGRSASKADLQFDAEPEFISLSADQKTAYVSLQENNAIAQIDVATGTLKQVNGLGLKDLNDPNNALDLIREKPGRIRFENVPFYGVYMPDGIATYTVDGKTYVLTANEGDATEWEARDNVSTIGDLKGSLDPDSAAAKFLANKTAYDGTEVMTSMDNKSIYLYGGRSFSIWDSTQVAGDGTLQQVYDSGSDFERIIADRLPDRFNVSHDDPTMDKRSPKKGPEPEYVQVGQIGAKTYAFVGLEREGGVMVYDVTTPTAPKFANYINTSKFIEFEDAGPTVAGEESDAGPEGLDFIAAADSPTGKPLLLVANEVGGTVAVLQMNAGDDTGSDNGGNNGNNGGNNGGNSGGNNGDSSSGGSTTPQAPSTTGGVVSTVVSAKPDANGKAAVAITADQVSAALSALTAASASGATAPVIEFKATVDGAANAAAVNLPAAALANIAASNASAARFDIGIGIVEWDADALDAAASQAKQDAVSLNVDKISAASLPSNASTQAIGNRPVYRLTMTTSSGNTVSSFGSGAASVSIPYAPAPGEDPNAIIIYNLTPNGEAAIVPNAHYDTASGQVKFRVGRFSTYAVGYNKVTFTDTADSDANAAIAYLAAREIVSGTGAGKFSPEAKLSRADFALLLARIAGQAENGNGSMPFKDVLPNAYYAQAVQWAAANGIILGTGNGRFDPKASVTHEQIGLIVARLSEYLNEPVPSGLIANSKAAATRAEAAQTLVQLVDLFKG